MNPISRGSLAVLDCTEVHSIDGKWMLEIMTKAVDFSGARRVHAHVEEFDGSKSPEGFAAVILLDESHLSAHHYAKEGLLAIDAFTCGKTDPSVIIQYLHNELKKEYPDLIANMSHQMRRFGSIPEVGNIRPFVEKYFLHFNAAVIRDASRSLSSFLSSGGKLLISLAGAMSTAEIGRLLNPLIRLDMVHAISCTGANLEEDLFHLIAGSHYERVPNWRNLTAEDDYELLSKGMNRVTDTCIPEEQAIRKIEPLIISQWSQGRAFPHEHIWAILEDFEFDMPSTSSWLVAAKEKNIPIIVPGWEDSTLGNIFAAACMKGEVNPEAVKSGIEYMIEFSKWYRKQSSPVGMLQVGGGIAGDFPICVVPLLNQDMGMDVPKWQWFGQISESNASYGGYSGASPEEKISWGKLDVDTPMFRIESDASIVLPLMLSYVMEGFHSH